MPAATMPTSQRIGAPSASASRAIATTPGGVGEIADDVRHAAGMHDARCDGRDLLGQRREIDLRRDDLEGAARDLGRIADVVEPGHFRFSERGPSGWSACG